jgi:hypothetical protein
VIKFKCVYCGQRILAGNKGAGKKGKCPKCNRLLVIPDATKIGTALSPDKEPIPERTLPHSPESGKDPRLDSDEPTEYFAEIFKEKFGFLIPTYDAMSLFLMAVTWILLYIVNNQLNQTIQTFLMTQHWSLIIYVLTIPAAFLIIGIYQIFIKREKSDFERTIMLWFAIVTNILTGIVASVYIIKNIEVRNWQLIFSIWNIVNAVVLYLMLVADFIDENCIVDRQTTPAQIVLGTAVTIVIVLICNYVLKLHWSITFSICIVYTTSFDRGLQSVFPGLTGQKYEQSSEG